MRELNYWKLEVGKQWNIGYDMYTTNYIEQTKFDFYTQ